MSIRHVYHYSALQQGPDTSVNHSDGLSWTNSRIVTAGDYIKFKAGVQREMAGSTPCTLTSLTYLYTEEIADEDMS